MRCICLQHLFMSKFRLMYCGLNSIRDNYRGSARNPFKFTVFADKTKIDEKSACEFTILRQLANKIKIHV